jgi:hypothetical protein
MTNPPNSEAIPDWAIEYARASLAIGKQIPAIEKQLVARGLTPEVATAVTTRLLDDRLRKQTAPVELAERRLRVHRIASALVACACIFLAYQSPGGAIRATMLGTFVSLACIWFGDEIGSNERFEFSFAGPTPGVVVCAIGWVILLLITSVRLALVLFGA